MKTDEEKEFDEVLDKYIKKFGRSYPFMITSTKTLREHIETMKNAIKNGVKVPYPVYKDGGVY